jgi:hypothetical protein
MRRVDADREVQQAALSNTVLGDLIINGEFNAGGDGIQEQKENYICSHELDSGRWHPAAAV